MLDLAKDGLTNLLGGDFVANEKDDTTVENRERVVADANRTYFLALADTRGSLGRLGLLAFVIIVLLGMDTFIGLNALIFWEGARWYLWLFNTHLVVLGLCALFVGVSPFKKLTHRFQTFFSSVMAGLAALLVYSICMMAVALTSFNSVRGEGLVPTVFGVVEVLSVVLLGGATVVHVLLLRRRLRVGHSEKRTMWNHQAVSGSNRSRMYWIIFGVVTVVPTVVTQGRYLMNTFGVLALALFVLVTTSLPVEFTYLAYLKSKDRAYWERLPRLTVFGRERLKAERARAARKLVMWVLIVVVGIALMWVLNAVLPPGWPGR